ncbi:MAG: TSUP family transporter [Planctomycetota bacterium]
MEPNQLVIMISIAVVLALGSMLQSAAGFGFGLFTIPLLILLGCRSYEAIVMVSVAAAAHAVVGVIVLRRHVRWKRILVMIVIACVAMPFGVAVLGVLAEQDRSTVRRVFGAIVLFAVLLQITFRVKLRDRLHPSAMVAATLASAVQLTLLWREFGPPVVDAAGLGLAYIPATLVGLLPGLWIGHHISKPRLRTISTIILLAIALYALLAP